MKTILLFLLSVPALFAQNVPQVWAFQTNNCQASPVASACRQVIQVLAAVNDSSVTGFEVTIEYVSADGQTHTQTAYIKAGVPSTETTFRSGAAFFYDVDDARLVKVLVDPQSSVNGKTVRLF